MRQKRKPILVTGSHRSGTTWIGKVLAAAPQTTYIEEHFNIKTSRDITNPFKNWFQYVCDENEYQYKEELIKIYNFYNPLGSNLAKARTPKRVAKIVRDQGGFLYSKARNYTPSVKPPMMRLSCFAVRMRI